MKDIDYKCQRAKVRGYWNCSCRECVKRQQANARRVPQSSSLVCKHNVPLIYSCTDCGDPF